MEITKILEREKFIKGAEQKGKKNKKIIEIILSYDDKKNPAISRIVRISKPSKRIYLSFREIKPIGRDTGVQIISTVRGILTSKEAREKRVGGEVLCEVQ